jgi:hypothetical protein
MRIPTGYPAGKYARLGYKRLILDYHYSEFVPHTLVNANSKEIIDAMEYLGIDSLLLYSKDQWGNVYHRTEIGHNHKNVPFDLFGEVSTGLKAKGIETIAYTTVCWDERAVREHPEWRVVNAQGKVVQMRYMPDEATGAKWSYLCINTGYREYVLAQIRELVENYDLAALFLDIVLYVPRATDCYCVECQKRWRAKYEEDIPREMTPENVARYCDFITESFDSFYRQVKDIISATGKDIWTTHNFGTFYDHDDYVVMEIDPFGRDYFRSSMLAKTFRARFNGGEVELIGHRHNGDWDFTIKPIPTLKWEAATVVAHDCAIMYVDQPHIKGDLDPVVYESMREAFKTADELSPHVQGTTPYAEIALLDSERSLFMSATDEILDKTGAYKMLTELHVPFDIISDRHFSLESLQEFALLVVPGTEFLGDKQVNAITQYVKQGGNVLFSGRSAFGDDVGHPRLQKAFGIIEPLGPSEHLVDFIKPTFPTGETRFKVKAFEHFKPEPGAEVLAIYTPPCMDVTETEWVAHQPMPGIDTDKPAAVLGQFGNGKYVYFGCDIFRDYLSQDHPAMREMIRKCIERLSAPRVRVQAPRVVEAVFTRRDEGFTIFLISGITSKPCAQPSWHSGQFIFHANIDDAIPIHDIRIELKGYEIHSAINLAGTALKITGDSIHVPKLGLYDAITICATDRSA